ncbi:TonB-dependent receptor [Duncaniella freteri]|uniref:SusC/RagA family TonB-linked outer membrane protein n=3 Tax=Duncaniella TaxID=2518495 RepID=UPI0023D2054B|nr:TonB-dependent receptor [Duncaniella freteri]MDE7028331.1 TonB-dependent receptor [Duncaniella freteri]
MHWKAMLLLLVLCVGLPARAQNITVNGVVEDSAGEPMIGATVLVDGSKDGVATDFDGRFTIKCSPKARLQVSYIGYKTQTIDVNGQTEIKVVLLEDSEALEEVVVIGYGGTRARRDLTGSVGSVSGVKLAAVPVTSAAVALQGKVAGVQVTTVDGQPGADINIRVRGATSVTQSNDPLYIVDGFQTDNINDIPPSDIQSIDILKDASLTAIYGAKGGNGVVIVTTKSAAEGKTQVNFNAQGSISHISKKMDLMGAYDFVNYQWDYATGHSTRNSQTRKFRYNFGNPQDMDLYRQAPSHDWQDEVMGNNPFSYSTNLSIGGGNDKTRYNISITQSDDRGVIMGSGVRRTNIHTKLQTKILPNLTLQYNPKMSYRRDEGAGGDNIGSGGIIDVLRYRPTNGIREFGAFWDENTVDPDQEAIFQYTNPVADIQTNVRKKHAYTFVNQAALEWKPISGLNLRTEGVYSIQFKDDKRFWGRLTSEGKKYNSKPVAQIEKLQTNSYTWTTTASYDWTINDKHNFYALAGFELYHKQTEKTTQKNRYFPDNITADKALDNMSLGTPYQSSSERGTAIRTTSYFGQLNYNFDHKYLLSATFRADGSSMFAHGHQWGYFPSVSAAWVLSEENFLKDVEWLNELKFRAAIGKAGNNNIDADMWRYLYTTKTEGGPAFGEVTPDGELWYGPADYLPNPELKWETTLTRNFAFDIALFNNRLRITPEYYWNTTSDLIYKADILSTVGYQWQYRNIGQVTNRGFELSVNGDILRGKDYVLSANFNLGANKMKVDKLNGDAMYLYDTHKRSKDGGYNYRLEVGGEVGLIYGFQYDGLYSVDEFNYNVANSTYEPKLDENGKQIPVNMNNIFKDSQSGKATLPGKPKFKDQNGDGIIDDDDRVVIGRTTPKLQGGFGLSGQYKNFDFTANFTYFLDFDVYNATSMYLSSSIDNENKFYNVLGKYTDRWRYADGAECYYGNYWILGAHEHYLAMNEGQTNWNPMDWNKDITASCFVEDGSFMRCTDITLGYTMPQNLINKAGMSKCRFYASVTNPFIITNYSGFDPEVDIQSGLTPSFDMNRYPRSRSYVLGINLSF